MAEVILAAKHSTEYRLGERERWTLISKSDDPDGKISHINLIEIEQERQQFINSHGDDGLGRT